MINLTDYKEILHELQKRKHDLKIMSGKFFGRYLSSLRSYLSEEEYIRFIAEHSEYHELSLELEKKITTAKGEFEASRENRMLSALKIYKEEGNVASYYEEIDKIIYRLKEDYLQLVEE